MAVFADMTKGAGGALHAAGGGLRGKKGKGKTGREERRAETASV